MTREEAIEELKTRYLTMSQCLDKEELHKANKAIDMAIKALSRQPCEDAINRQAAIDEVKFGITYATRFDIHTGGQKILFQAINDELEKAIERIKQLPSVSVAEKVGHWIKTPKAVMGEGYMWYCDKCEHQVYQDSSRPYPSEKYCPICGARMIEPQESEDKE